MKLRDYVWNKPVLETPRLVLRPLRREDAADLEKWLADESIYRYWGKRPGKCDRHPELLFEREARPTKSFHWGLVPREAGKVEGELWVYLVENDRMAKVAFRLAPAFQGRRLMAEALSRAVEFCFGETELRRLWADVHVGNAASWKTLKAAGFRREGCIREGKMVSTYCDYYLYGMTKGDYQPGHG